MRFGRLLIATVTAGAVAALAAKKLIEERTALEEQEEKEPLYMVFNSKNKEFVSDFNIYTKEGVEKTSFQMTDDCTNAILLTKYFAEEIAKELNEAFCEDDEDAYAIVPVEETEGKE